MLVIAGVLATAFLFGQEEASPFKVPEGGGIVYGDELGVGVAAPAGWVFDAESGVNQGLHAVMYPLGSSWSDAKEIMYVNVGRMEAGQTLDSFIAADIARFRAQAPDLVVKTADSIEVRSGPRAEVRLYSGDAWGNSEAVAYAALGSSVAIYVLSCRTSDGFSRSLPAFKEMIARSFLAAMVFKE